MVTPSFVMANRQITLSDKHIRKQSFNCVGNVG